MYEWYDLNDAINSQRFKITEIVPDRLYISGFLDDVAHKVKENGIGLVISNTQEVPRFIDGVTFVRFPFHDQDELPNMNRLRTVAKFAANWNERTGEAVLTHCAAGLNRSGLTCALVMKEMYPEMSGPEILKHIRSLRQAALFNQTFESAVRSL